MAMCVLRLPLWAAGLFWLATSLAQATDFVHTGGQWTDGHLCPGRYNDVIVPLASLDPPPYLGETTMTIEGLNTWIGQKRISSIEALLADFPAHFRTHFSLVEHTRATGESNLQFPRIVLFSPDGYLLFNIGTKADDPNYMALDVAELDPASGLWEFSVFDFSGPEPKLQRSPGSCLECHGQEPRPVWGSNMEWTGVFGNNAAPGLHGEALDDPHAVRMTEIQAGKGGNPRFDFLRWANRPLTRGGIRPIADHAFGAELLVSNMAIGSATARGIFLRLTQTHPERYQILAPALLLAGYERMTGGLLPIPLKASIAELLQQFDVLGGDMDAVLQALGIDARQSFSLATLAEREPARPDWSLGGAKLYELVLLQVLDDLAERDPKVAELLRQTPALKGVHGCPDTLTTLDELVDFKMLYLFELRGRARYEVHRVFYPRAVEHVYDRIFQPIARPLNRRLGEMLSDSLNLQ